MEFGKSKGVRIIGKLIGLKVRSFQQSNWLALKDLPMNFGIVLPGPAPVPKLASLSTSTAALKRDILGMGNLSCWCSTWERDGNPYAHSLRKKYLPGAATSWERCSVRCHFFLNVAFNGLFSNSLCVSYLSSSFYRFYRLKPVDSVDLSPTAWLW